MKTVIPLKANLLLVLPILLVAMVSTAYCGTEKIPAGALEKIVLSVKKEHPVPAVAAAVVNSRGIIQQFATGLKKLGETKKISPGDRFHIGSCTKSITALLAARLVKKGLIRWGSSIGDIYPQWKGQLKRGIHSITLKELLMHRAGIPPFLHQQDWNKLPTFEGSLVEQRKAFAFHVLSSIKMEPFGLFGYSNAGYNIAASLLEAVTGKTWETLVREEIFKPLGLNSAGFGHPAVKDPTQPWGHWQRWQGRTPTEPVQPGQYHLHPIDAPAGDVYMSVSDFAQYARFHLRGLLGKDQLWGSKAIKALHTPEGQYAYGWFVQEFGGHRCSIHWGSPATFFAGIVVCREKDLAAVVMANSGDPDTKTACRIIMEKIMSRFSK